jgi:hypothetical protein
LQQRDNVLIVPSENVLLLKKHVLFSNANRSKENRDARGTYHIESKRD